MAVKFTILSESRVPSPDESRVGSLDTMVLFSVDGGGNDAVIVAGTDPTDEQVIAAVEEQVAKKGARVGRTLGG